MYKNIPHKTALLESMQKSIPHKTGLLESVQNRHPLQECVEEIMKSLDLSGTLWINQKMRSEVSSDKKTKLKKCTGELNSEVKQLLTKVQRKHCQSYWNYKGKLFTEQHNRKLSHGLKRFWTSMKHQRTANWGQGPWLSHH